MDNLISKYNFIYKKYYFIISSMFRTRKTTSYLDSFPSSHPSARSTRDSSCSTPYSRIGSVVGNQYKFIGAIVENRMREVCKLF